jgi:hypothetical protein
MIRFTCVCGQELQARDDNAGKVVLCPACKQRVKVPNVPSTAIASEEPVESSAPQQRVQRKQPRPHTEEWEEREEESAPSQPVGNSGKAVTSLILGIASLFCNVLTGLPALIVGILALRDIGRSNERLAGRGLATAGIITACVGTLLSCVVLSIVLVPLMILAPAVQKVREAAERAESTNNLKKITLALQNYNATNSSLPPAALVDLRQPPARQKPLLSWRVAILPFIEQELLYSQFRLDEPWDSPNNIKLLARIPRIYRMPSDDKTPPDHTHYQALVGNGTAFDKTKPINIPKDFPDGTSNTILIVEAEKAVPWTKPEDVPFDPSKPIVPLMSRHFPGGFHVGLADGSVRQVASQISETTLKAAITRRGGEPLGPDWPGR